jgi:hypothetical protein
MTSNQVLSDVKESIYRISAVDFNQIVLHGYFLTDKDIFMSWRTISHRTKFCFTLTYTNCEKFHHKQQIMNKLYHRSQAIIHLKLTINYINLGPGFGHVQTIW